MRLTNVPHVYYMCDKIKLENWIKNWKSCWLKTPLMTWNSQPWLETQNSMISDRISEVSFNRDSTTWAALLQAGVWEGQCHSPIVYGGSHPEIFQDVHVDMQRWLVEVCGKWNKIGICYLQRNLVANNKLQRTLPYGNNFLLKAMHRKVFTTIKSNYSEMLCYGM